METENESGHVSHSENNCIWVELQKDFVGESLNP